MMNETDFKIEVSKVNIFRKAFCRFSHVGRCFEQYHMARNVPKTTTGIAAFSFSLRLGASVKCCFY